jgi:8-oxo-dGTP pyrophosphatase MutT (NUDIX family)
VVYRASQEGPQFALIKANGRWSFPKGAMEKGETPEVTALREISEETGLPLGYLRIIRALPSIEYTFRWEGRLVFKTVHNFLVSFSGGAALSPQLSEVEEARWFDAEAARKTLSFKNSLGTLEAAVASVDDKAVAS